MASRRLQRALHSEHAAGWAFAAPGVALIALFGLVPIVWSFVLSFQETNLLAPERPFVGLDNYERLKDDPLFEESVRHTLTYTALFVPLSVGGGLLIAVALNRQLRFIRLYRTAVFVPVVASTIATSIIFLNLFDPNFGLANWALGGIGLGPNGYLQDPDQALYAIVILTTWGWIGFNVIVYLAALQGVPRELHRGRRRSTARRRFGRPSAGSPCRCSGRPRCSSSCGRRSTRCSCSTRSTS